MVFECESLDWEQDDPRRSTWDGETGTITVYAKPGRVQIVSAQVTGSVDDGPSITVKGTIEGDVIRFDVSDDYEEGHTFIVTQFFFEETCGQVYYSYFFEAPNLPYGSDRPLLVDCSFT